MSDLPAEWTTVPVRVNWPAPKLEAVDVPGGEVELQTPRGERVALVDEDWVIDLKALA